MTYRELLALDIEFQSLPKRMPGIALMLRPKISQFYKETGVRLQTARDRIKALNTEYRQCDEHGNPFTCDGQPVMLPGKTWEEYQQKAAEFLDTEVNIIL